MEVEENTQRRHRMGRKRQTRQGDKIKTGHSDQTKSSLDDQLPGGWTLTCILYPLLITESDIENSPFFKNYFSVLLLFPVWTREKVCLNQQSTDFSQPCVQKRPDYRQYSMPHFFT